MLCCACTDKESELVVQEIAIPAVKDEAGIVAEVAATTDDGQVAETEQPAPEPEDAPKGSVVHVLVLGARGIRNADWMPGSGVSDAFVVVDIDGQGGFSTPVIKDSLQPVWNHEGELVNVPEGATISLTVYDQDPGSKNLLGKAKIEASQYAAEGFNGELELAEAGAGIKAFLKVKVKVSGKDYPPPLGSQFTVTVEKTPGSGLGLDVDLLDGATLHVTDVKPGAVANWNAEKAAQPELQVIKGLYVISVNGASGNAAELISRLKEDSKITLTLRRPQLFPISISKKAGTLGLDLNYAANGIALLIIRVNDGPVADWNAANKDHEVKRNDRIVSVNGISGGTKELYDAIKGSDQLQLQISRPATDTWWGCH